MVITSYLLRFCKVASAAQKKCFPLKPFSVNVTAFAVVTFTEGILSWKLSAVIKYYRMHSIFTKINSCLVPLRSAQGIYCHEVTAFTIFIKWLRAPKAYMQGIRTGYNLYYQNSTNSFNITNIPPQRESITVIGLEPNTWFHFQLGAMTSIGEGNKSEIISCKTKMSGRRKNFSFGFQ